MTRDDLVRATAERSDITIADARRVVGAALEVVAETLAAGEDVTISGFGRFVIKQTAERQARNPRTGEPVRVAASARVRFLPVPTLRQRVARDPRRRG